MQKQTKLLVALLMVGVSLAAGQTGSCAAEVELKKGDHICLVGNALGERLQTENDWESLLHQRFADL